MRKLSFVVTLFMCLFFTTTTFASADARVVNNSGAKVWAVWQAWGCFNTVHYGMWELNLVCSDKPVPTAAIKTYKFKWGTSGRRVWIFGYGDNKKDVLCVREYKVSGDTTIVLNNPHWCPGSK